jgi:site-specific DNA-cytosine methylase
MESSPVDFLAKTFPLLESEQGWQDRVVDFSGKSADSLTKQERKLFILENVPGLLSSNNGRDMAVVIEALVERGYRIAWRVLDAQYFGVPQRRRRVFIVGCLGNQGRSPEEILAISEGRAGYLAKSNPPRKDTASATARGSRISGGEIVGALQFSDYKFPQQQLAADDLLDNKAIVGSDYSKELASA